MCIVQVEFLQMIRLLYNDDSEILEYVVCFFIQLSFLKAKLAVIYNRASVRLCQ